MRGVIGSRGCAKGCSAGTNTAGKLARSHSLAACNASTRVAVVTA
jgi:hypothetical protein